VSARRVGRALVAAGLAVAGTGLALGPGSGSASSHREAPLTAANPLADSVDTYAFVSPDKPDTVTLIATWIPFQDPSGGPTYFPWGAGGYRYNIKVDNNGDAVPDITYRWTFTNIDTRGTDTFLYNTGPVNSFDDATLRFKQTYKLEKIDEAGTATTLVDNGKTAPSRVGDASFPNYAALRDEALSPLQGVSGTTFAGQADDPFFLDLRIFNLLYGGDLSETGNDTLTNYNVNALALQVPISEVTEGGDGSGIIGVWQTTDQQTMTLSAGESNPTGDFVQVSRLGMPLVNEVVVPAGLKDAFNSLPPEMDADTPAVVAKVNDPEVPKLIEALYKLPAPATPREDLVSVFLTGVEGLNKPPNVRPAEMMRLNTGIAPSANPNRLGVLAMDTGGFPNGRRLADDVVDISLQALQGAVRTGMIVEALKAGDGVNENDKPFGSTFPYLALPESGSSTAARGSSVGGGGGGSTPGGGGSGGTGGTAGSGGSRTGGAPTGGVATGFGGLADGGLPVLPVSIVLVGLALAGSGLVLRKRAAQ
jgi:hypothetical protein